MITRTAAHLHLRIYLAAIGATGALLAAALVIFSLVGSGAFLEGLPFGGSGGAGSVNVGSHSRPGTKSVGEPAGSPQRAASHEGAGKRGSDAFRRADLRHRSRAGRGGSTGASSDGSTSSTVTGPTGRGTPQPGGGPVTPRDGGGGGSPSGPSPVTNAVRQVDQATGQNLSGSTGGTTGQVDQTSNSTLNQAGGTVGKPHLGDDASNTLSGLGGGG